MGKGEGRSWERCVRVVSWKKWEDSELARLERWEVARWQFWKGGRIVRWERWESIEVTRWEVPGFIQGLRIQGGSKISSFCF